MASHWEWSMPTQRDGGDGWSLQDALVEPGMEESGTQRVAEAEG